MKTVIAYRNWSISLHTGSDGWVYWTVIPPASIRLAVDAYQTDHPDRINNRAATRQSAIDGAKEFVDHLIRSINANRT